MNKQCQQPQAHPDRCGCVREIAEHNAQAYAEAIAALAAKDARIAELEASLRQFMKCAYPVSDVIEASGHAWCNSWLDESLQEAERVMGDQQADPTMAKNANVAATPSEDGGEVPEVVGWLQIDATRNPGTWVSRHRQVSERAIDEGALAKPLMTVAQHSRIVAAKDAEIARVTVERNRLIGNARSVFKDMAEMALKQRDELAKELAALRAQPARQVGGDGSLIPCPFCGCQATMLTDAENVRITGSHSAACPFRDVDVLVDGRDAWNTRAALAPAAVVSGGWSNGFPPAGELCEALIPHHTANGVDLIWCEVEVIAHAIVKGVVYSWVKEPGEAGGYYAPLMLSFRRIVGRALLEKDGE